MIIVFNTEYARIQVLMVVGAFIKWYSRCLDSHWSCPNDSFARTIFQTYDFSDFYKSKTKQGRILKDGQLKEIKKA